MRAPDNRPSADPQQGFRDELLSSYPGRAERASSSRKAALELFCMECVGGTSVEAGRCQSRGCFLWPHGFGRAKR